MNYELAKELKEAGFPQNIHGDYYCEDCSECIGGGSPEKYKKSLLESLHPDVIATFVAIPILEELIEACLELEVNVDLRSYCYHRFYAYESPGIDEDRRGLEYEGSTSSEAVARLWLSLNTK